MILTWHTLRCPHCGKEIPAYAHYLYNNKHSAERKTDRTLLEWLKLQFSLFDDQHDTLNFQLPEYCDKKYTCLRCGNVSHCSDKELEIIMGCNKSYVYIMREIKDINDVMELKWLTSKSLPFSFPMYERILFDFDRGTTAIQLIINDNVWDLIDITETNLLTDSDILIKTICQNNVVKRTLKKFFQRYWHSEIPFATDEITLHKLILITRFIDFSKEFYNAIPFEGKSNRLDHSFDPVLKKLSNPECAMKMLANSSLPYTKSIKRLFTKKNGLFFYIEECKTLFDIIDDLNLFCRIMNSSEAYHIVSTLHYYPAIANFYRDYGEVKGKNSLCHHLLNHLRAVNHQAIIYCSLSSYGKDEEQLKWIENKRFFEQNDSQLILSYSDFSAPMHTVPQHINDCTIDCFHFKWLRTKCEYKEAGRKLDNCLGNWSCHDNPVVAVYKGKKVIAAIEVNENRIIQAYRSHNNTINKHSALFLAIEKWCDKYSLTMTEWS